MEQTVRTDIQGLRAIAVLLVVLFHAGAPGITGGFIGVDVFFVISGYLIIKSLDAQISRNGINGILVFYLKRIRRLAPALSLMLLTSIFVIFFIYSPIDIIKFVKAALSSVLYFSNYYFYYNYVAYFAGSSGQNPFIHTWSLSVEEQFYIFSPLCVLFFRYFFPKANLIWALGAVFLLSLCWSVYLTQKIALLAFYSSPTRVFEFAAGGIAAYLPDLRTKFKEISIFSTTNIAVSLGLFAIVVSAFTLNESMIFPGALALVPTLATSLILYFGRQLGSRGAGRILEFGPLCAIGDVSYSLYLWHWPLLVFLQVLYPSPSISLRLGAIATALALAHFSTNFIENPVRRNAWISNLSFSNRAIVLNSVSIVTIVALAGTYFFAHKRLSADGLLQAVDKARFAHSSFEDIQKCNPDLLSNSDVPFCPFGNTKSDQTVVLMGDSIARQWFTAVNEWAKARNIRLMMMVRMGCSPVDVPAQISRQQLDTACVEWRHRAYAEVADLRPKLLILISSRWFVDTKSDAPTDGRLSIAAWKQHLTTTLEGLDNKQVPVAWLKQTPSLPHDPVKCLSSKSILFQPVKDICFESTTLALPKRLTDVDSSVSSRLPRVRLLSFTDDLCSGDACPLIYGNTIVFRDTSHFSESFVRSRISKVAQALDGALK